MSDTLGGIVKLLQTGRSVRGVDLKEGAAWASALAAKVRERQDDIGETLWGYSTQPYIEDEVSRSLFLLDALSKDPSHLVGVVPRGAGFMPRNQLLYSLIYMGAVPYRFADRYAVRPSAPAFERVHRLAAVLDFHDLCPGLELVATSYRAFLNSEAAGADFVVFTGSSRAGAQVRGGLQGTEVLLASGSGHNPILIGDDADLQDAARRIVRLCLYNQGQDCSAPSSILVPSGLVHSLCEIIEDRLRDVAVSDHLLDARYRLVGPNTDARHVLSVRKWLAERRDHLVFGGDVDITTCLIQPTVLVVPLAFGPEYREWFAPIIVLQPFDDVSELARYFATDAYRRNAMYLTLIGNANNVLPNLGISSMHPPQTILLDTDLHEHERGDREYGGFGEDASYIGVAGRRFPQPVLAQRELDRYVVAPRLATMKR